MKQSSFIWHGKMRKFVSLLCITSTVLVQPIAVLAEGGPGEEKTSEVGTTETPNQIQNFDISPFCNSIAQTYYYKPFPKYEELTVLYTGKLISGEYVENQEVKWVDIPDGWEKEPNQEHPMSGKFGMLYKTVHDSTNLKKLNTKYGHYLGVKSWNQPDEEKKKTFQAIFIDLLMGEAASKGEAPLSYSHDHGVKHSLRTSIAAKAIFQLYKQLYVEYASANEDDLLLSMAAASAHDSARQTEEMNPFESLSAEYCKKELITKGISSELAQKAQFAIENKDAEITNSFSKKGVIASTLHDACCIEKQRFSKFNYAYLDCHHLTVKSGISPDEAKQKITNFVAKFKTFIERTGKNDGWENGKYLTSFDYFNHPETLPNYGEFEALAMEVGLFDLNDKNSSMENSRFGKIASSSEVVTAEKPNQIQDFDISTFCDRTVKSHYYKPFPKYEGIYVLYTGKLLNGRTVENEKVKWVDIPDGWEKEENKEHPMSGKFGMLFEGATNSHSKKKLNQKYHDYLTIKQWNIPIDEKKKIFRAIFVDLLMGEAASKGEYFLPFSYYHGAKHSLRAAIVAQAIFELYKQLYVEYENANRDECLLSIAAASYHDSARQADDIDVFDPLSAKYCYDDLVKMGISSELANKARFAIENKDAKITDDFNEKGVIATTLHEADCMEMNRFPWSTFSYNFLDCHRLTLKSGITASKARGKITNLIAKLRMLIDRSGWFDGYNSKNGVYAKPSEYFGHPEKLANYQDLYNQAKELKLFDFEEDFSYSYKKSSFEPRLITSSLETNESGVLENYLQENLIDSEDVRVFHLLKNASKEPFELFARQTPITIEQLNHSIPRLKALPIIESDFEMLYKITRIDHLLQSFCQPALADGLKEKFVKETLFHRLAMSNEGMFESLPQKFTYRPDSSSIFDHPIVDEHHTPYGNLRGRNGVTGKFANYLQKIGGSVSFYNLIGSMQTESSSGGISTAVKVFFEKQFNGNSDFFYADDRILDEAGSVKTKDAVNPDLPEIPSGRDFRVGRDWKGDEGRKELKKNIFRTNSKFFEDRLLEFPISVPSADMYARYLVGQLTHLENTNEKTKYKSYKKQLDGKMCRHTIFALYALNQELMDRIEWEGKDDKNVTLYRRLSDGLIRGVFTNETNPEVELPNVGDKGKISSAAVYESTSAFDAANTFAKFGKPVFPLKVFKLAVPKHRVWYTYLTSHLFCGNEQVSFMDYDHTREFPACLLNVEAEYLGEFEHGTLDDVAGEETEISDSEEIQGVSSMYGQSNILSAYKEDEGKETTLRNINLDCQIIRRLAQYLRQNKQIVKGDPIQKIQKPQAYEDYWGADFNETMDNRLQEEFLVAMSGEVPAIDLNDIFSGFKTTKYWKSNFLEYNISSIPKLKGNPMVRQLFEKRRPNKGENRVDFIERILRENQEMKIPNNIATRRSLLYQLIINVKQRIHHLIDVGEFEQAFLALKNTKTLLGSQFFNGEQEMAELLKFYNEKAPFEEKCQRAMVLHQLFKDDPEWKNVLQQFFQIVEPDAVHGVLNASLLKEDECSVLEKSILFPWNHKVFSMISNDQQILKKLPVYSPTQQIIENGTKLLSERFSKDVHGLVTYLFNESKDQVFSQIIYLQNFLTEKNAESICWNIYQNNSNRIYNALKDEQWKQRIVVEQIVSQINQKLTEIILKEKSECIKICKTKNIIGETIQLLP